MPGQKELHLGFNRLAVVPQVILKCKALTRLLLNNNELTIISPDIWTLVDLKVQIRTFLVNQY